MDYEEITIENFEYVFTEKEGKIQEVAREVEGEFRSILQNLKNENFETTGRLTAFKTNPPIYRSGAKVKYNSLTEEKFESLKKKFNKLKIGKIKKKKFRKYVLKGGYEKLSEAWGDIFEADLDSDDNEFFLQIYVVEDAEDENDLITHLLVPIEDK
ncbi:hypothetical protein HDU92_004080 [Lobulomyces angularis]|nr:hypothetical protein HDU92_004080 [Lobulomyces angularis]